MPFYLWSSTASANATGDPSINWAEGMAPSAVNDSARAMMARLKEYNNDIAGWVVTAGTSTAYTLATHQVFNTLANMNAAMVAFTPHATNGATVTLNVDGLGAKPLRYGPSLELQSGVLIQGTPYVATYNNSDGAFYLQGGFANPYGIPLGGLLPYIGSTAPNTAFALPIGQAVSRTTYATLFTLVSTTFGVGDGSTTFNLPDLRGRAVFSPDSGGSGRITVAGGNFDGTVLGNTGGGQNKTIANGNLPASIPYTDTGHAHGPGSGATDFWGTPGTTIDSVGSGTNNVPRNRNASTASATTGITINPGGANTPLPIIPNAIILPYILRII